MCRPNWSRLLSLICWTRKIFKKLKAEFFYRQICAIFACLGSSTKGWACIHQEEHLLATPRELKEAGRSRRREGGSLRELREKQLTRPASAQWVPENSGYIREALAGMAEPHYPAGLHL